MPTRFFDVNDGGDVLSWVFTGQNWLARNGVFYQVFGDRLLNGLRLNNRSEAVGFGIASTPNDIFLSAIDLIVGDHDEDGDIDLNDLSGLDACLAGPGIDPADDACLPLDGDQDDDVDLRDVAAFQLAFTGECAVGITTPPDRRSACEGDRVSIGVDVRGPAERYQWFLDETDIPGATGPELVIESVGPEHEGAYGLRVTSTCGWEIESTKRHELTVLQDPPRFREQPRSQSACPGEDVRFCVRLQAKLFDTFQWEKDGAAVETDGDWWCYILRDVRASDAGEYRVKAANECGETYSNTATLTIETPTGPPLITVNPYEEIVMPEGGTAWFRARAWCAESYQWQKDGEDIPGATERELVIYPVTCADSGEYRIVASNAQGRSTSVAGILAVPDCP